MSRRNMLPQSIRQSVQRQARQVLTTGQRFDRFDQIRQRHFWSDFLFAPDVNGMIQAGDYKVFTTPSGQAGQGYPIALTDRETNWKSANRVPDNQNFEILELGVSLQTLPAVGAVDTAAETIPPNSKQSIAFLQNTLLAIQYLTNEISLGYCQDYSQAAGSMMGTYSPAIPGTFNRSYTTNGFSAPGLRRRLRIPILLQHGETFTFNFKVLRAFFVPRDNNVPAPPFVARMDFWATESFVERS